MIFNPWGEINNFKNLIDTNDKISVYGVISNKRPLTQHEIKLNIQKNDDTISLMTNVDEKTGFRNLYIKITKDKGIIENISKSEIYTGSEYLQLFSEKLYFFQI